MQSKKNLTSLSLVISFLFLNNVSADTSGITLDGLPSKATFVGKIEHDNQPALSSTIDINKKIDVSFEINIAPEEVGQLGLIYVVAEYNHAWFQKTPSGWEPWNLYLDALKPYLSHKILNSQESLVVQNQLSGLVGDFNIYVGYRLENQLNYNAKPLSFNVAQLETTPTPTILPTAVPSPTPIPQPAIQTLDVKSTGAKGDGKTDDTAAIQAAIDKLANTNGTVIIPSGTYLVDAVKSVRLRDNMSLKMADDAIIEAIPTSSSNYNVLLVENVSNVKITGGILMGERYTHKGTYGEWGIGLGIYNGNNITVEKVTAKNMWGDGFEVDHFKSNASKNISFYGVTADNNRRQGMSVIAADGVLIQDSLFQNTNGTAPAAGVDIEPNPGTSVNNVKVINCKFLNNQGQGFTVVRMYGPVTNVTVDGVAK